LHVIGWTDRHYIYGLYDPRTDECGYVGYTCDPRGRHRRHVVDAPKARYPVGVWIQTLLEADVMPDMRILEETSEEHWDAAERWWIHYMRSKGEPLTNVSPGGRLSGGYWRVTECG
jgi:hypothetical protein